MRYKLTHNLGLKLLSVLAACLIWLVVMDSNDPEKQQVYRNVPVTIKNQDTITNANKTYTVVGGTDKVSVYVTARRSVRTRLSASSFTVRADLENYNEAIGSVPLEVTCSDPSVSQEDMRIQPASMKIKMEDKIEETFGIVATTSGNAAKGFEVGSTTVLTGDTIKIAGPESLISIIGKVTVPVDVTYMSEDSVQQLPIRIEDKNGAELTDSQWSNLELKNMDGIVLKDNLAEVGVEIWRIYGEIALQAELTGEPASGYEVTDVTISPRTVNLTESAAAIEKLGNSLTLQDTFDISGVSENIEFTADLSNTLSQYEDVRLEADASPAVTVTVTIDEVGSKTIEFPVSELTLNNAPAGKRLIFSPTDKLAINIRSTEEHLGEIDVEDIKAEIDLSGCQANGSYTLPVTVEVPEGCELGAEVSIVVNVEEEEQEAEVELQTEE